MVPGTQLAKMMILIHHLQLACAMFLLEQIGTSYQVREPIENDKERLAMKKGDMPPPVPERVANPRIRKDQVLHEFHSKLGPDAPCYPRLRFHTCMVRLQPICLPAI